MASAAAAEEIVFKEVGPYLVDTDIDRALSSTYCSQVFAGKHATSGEKVAAKLIPWGIGLLEPPGTIDREVELSRKLPPHENTVKFYDYIKKYTRDQWQLWFMLEKCNLGDLKKFSTTNKLDVKKTLDLFLQAAKGLQHIHDNKLVHRNIKLENLLVHGSKDNPVVKISEFGISRGTIHYKAPELFTEGKPNAGKEVDTFSLAVSILSLLDPQDASRTSVYTVDGEPLGQYLHRHPNTNVSALINMARDTEDQRRIKQVLAAMLAPAAADRPTMEQVVAQLSHLHMKVLPACNTAWESSRLLTDEENLHDVKTAIIRALKLRSADGIKEEEVSVAVDTWENKGVWILDGKGRWVKLSDVPKKCRIYRTCVCGIPGGFVLLGGIGENSKVTSECWIFYRSSQWEEIPPMHRARRWVSAALVGHSIFAFGGMDKGNTFDVVERFDLAERQWSRAASMPKAMHASLIAAASGQIYIKAIDSRHFYCFEPEQNSYTAIPVPDFVPTMLIRHCMISHNNKLYLLGGEDKRVAIQYDLLTKSWLQLTPPRAYYYEGCSAITRDNALLLCGGSTKGKSEQNIVEKYDVATDAWERLEVRLPYEFWDYCCRVLNCRN